MLDQIGLLIAQTILISIPLILAALGGVFSERAGVVNIALEGVLLTGAFAAAVIGHASGSFVVGILGGFIGYWLLPKINVHINTGTSWLNYVLTAAIGALVLLVVVNLIFGRSRRA